MRGKFNIEAQHFLKLAAKNGAVANQIMDTTSLSCPRQARRHRSGIILVVLASAFYLLLSLKTPLHASPQDAEKLGRSAYCGLCHTDIYQQWNASTHHFSSFNNPIYRKVILENVGLEDVATRKFCSGCHDPILKTADLDEIDINSWQANSGITCLACHRMTDIGEKNGDYTIKAPFLHPFALADDPTLHRAHEIMLERSPWLHRNVLSKKSYKQPQFCAACHSLEVPASINGHQDLRILDEYRSWQNSPYAPANSTHQNKGQANCQSCHMPLVPSSDPAAVGGMVHDHSFAAGNTALPVFNRDFDHLNKVEKFLTNNIMSVSLNGVRKEKEGAWATPENIHIEAGDIIELSILVSNTGVGHHFPGGTADSNEAWIAVECLDENGNLLAARGLIEANAPLPENIPRFGVHFVDALGKVTNRGTTTTRAVSKKIDTRIPPGESRVVETTIEIPHIEARPVRMRVSLNWRKYGPEFIAWVFAGRWTSETPITTLSRFEFDLGGTEEIATLNPTQQEWKIDNEND